MINIACPSRVELVRVDRHRAWFKTNAVAVLFERHRFGTRGRDRPDVNSRRQYVLCPVFFLGTSGVSRIGAKEYSGGRLIDFDFPCDSKGSSCEATRCCPVGRLHYQVDLFRHMEPRTCG